MGRIEIKIIEDGNIEVCRDLCNELMAYQKSMAHTNKEAFDVMNFDTRMLTSYNSALENLVVILIDDDVPVGYAYASTSLAKDSNPMFHQEIDAEHTKFGSISNVFLRKEYRGKGFGKQLIDMCQDWLDSFDDVNLCFVHISNGNDAIMTTYEKYGYKYSHDVRDGFIKTMKRYRVK